MQLVDFILHIDKHLAVMLETYGLWVYAILFLIVFCETGLVVTPLLPGDSLLFATGALAASTGALDIWILAPLLMAATFLGDNTNYWIGRYLGPRVFASEQSMFFRREYLDKTRQFFEKYGPKAVVIARFVPIVRTFSPFVAGIGAMSYFRFLAYSVAGAALWIGIFLVGGYCLGGLDWVKNNFKYLVLIIIAVSIFPIAFEIWCHRSAKPHPSEA